MQESSLAAMSRVLGARGRFRTTDGLVMDVRVIDVKNAWGNLRYVIRSWNDASRIDAPTITVDAKRVEVETAAAA